MLDNIFHLLSTLHPLVVDRTIYIPSWETTEDEIYEISGLADSLVILVGDYYRIDVPEDDGMLTTDEIAAIESTEYEQESAEPGHKKDPSEGTAEMNANDLNANDLPDRQTAVTYRKDNGKFGIKIVRS